MEFSSNETTAASSGGYSAEKPTAILTAVTEGVSKAGARVNGSSAASSLTVGRMISSSDCDTHGDPASHSSPSDPLFPGYLTYCKMTVDDGSPDTLQGSFSGVKGIICEVERAGFVFDGAAHDLSLTPSLSCFTQAEIDDMIGDGMSTFEITATGSNPASFNRYFDRGVVLDVTGFGTYQVGTKVTATKIEILTYEYQSATKAGTTYGSIDLSTGEIRGEARMERIDCTESGSCGWNRHWRVYAKMNVVGGTIGDSLESISFAYSNIQSPPGQSSYGGVLVTTSGDMTNGIKARAFSATNGSSGAPTALSQYYTAANWTETANTKCYLGGDEDATTCGSGIAGFSTSSAFVLNSSASSAGTSALTFFTSFAGATYTDVNPNSETQ